LLVQEEENPNIGRPYQALDRLRSDDAPNRIRMVGSLRAGKDCMECHSVRRGELLGAFSYELVPVRPVPVKEPGA